MTQEERNCHKSPIESNLAENGVIQWSNVRHFLSDPAALLCMLTLHVCMFVNLLTPCLHSYTAKEVEDLSCFTVALPFTHFVADKIKTSRAAVQRKTRTNLNVCYGMMAKHQLTLVLSEPQIRCHMVEFVLVSLSRPQIL